MFQIFDIVMTVLTAVGLVGLLVFTFAAMIQM